MSQLKVNTIRHTGASSDAIELASDGSCTVKAVNNLSNHNIWINGACNLAQRGTSKAGAIGYQTVDRIKVSQSGGQNAPDTAQHALTSSDTGPWAKGFRNCFQLTNGDQTSADANDYCEITYTVEAQDMASCGWDYTNTSSYITFAFWVKSSVAQTFYGYIQTVDGSAQTYSYSFALSANTWTKVTKIIPGAANIAFDMNNGEGLRFGIVPFYGTDYTNNKTADTWAAHDGNNYFPDMASTWWLQDDATFELTGLQLTTTDYCPDYPHVSYAEDLRRCQRYYWQNSNNVFAQQSSSNQKKIQLWHPVPMRATPTFDHTDGGGVTVNIDSGTHQSNLFFTAYVSSAYDGSQAWYSSVKFSADF